MNKANFEKLITAVTGRELQIKTTSDILECGNEYYIYTVLPLTDRAIGFNWKAPLEYEKFLKTFITAFTSKFRQPNPKAYDYNYGGKEYKWSERTELEKEYAYSHHASNMYSKKALLEQIQANFDNPNIQHSLTKYGFYATNYGIGTFCYFATTYVLQSIQELKNFLIQKAIPYGNEFSDARWVYRFKLNLTKDLHESILADFSK